ncbi:MAG: flippase-like domain-containing protein [Chloroflexi bacterium]|nr:flippase-like domain-containing protein [Chloroflexota bacterium]
MRNRTRLVGFALTLVFLALAFWRVDFDELRTTLASANYWYVLPAAALTLVGYMWRSLRWKRILRPSASSTTRRLFPILMIGFMANNVLPVRMGEFVRAYYLQQQEGVRKSLGLATIFLERLFDGLVLVLFVGLLSLVNPLPDWGAELAYIAATIFLSAAAIIVALLFREDLFLRLVAVALSPLPVRIGEWVQSKLCFFVDGLEALRRRRAVASVIAMSILVWLCEASAYYLIMRGFSLPLAGAASVFAAIFLLVIVNLGIMVPSAPGYVGTFQFFGVLALSAFGVRRETALSVAIVSHTMQYILVTSIGLFFVWRMHLSWQRLGKDAQELA